jgi:hypothetical protein
VHCQKTKSRENQHRREQNTEAAEHGLVVFDYTFFGDVLSKDDLIVDLTLKPHCVLTAYDCDSGALMGVHVRTKGRKDAYVQSSVRNFLSRSSRFGLNRGPYPPKDR